MPGRPPVLDPEGRQAVERLGRRPAQLPIAVGRHRRPEPRQPSATESEVGLRVPERPARDVQPSIAGGRVFVGSETGTVYALDAATGCTYWSFKADGTVRTATSVATMTFPSPVIDQPPAARTLVFFGDQNGYVYALDADTGVLRWKVRADSHEAEIITGAPKYYDGGSTCRCRRARKVPAPSPRTRAARSAAASSRSMPATGHSIWQTYLVEEPKQIGAASAARRCSGRPASPSGRRRRRCRARAVYVTTGDNYS